jgi:hypothetical protein
MHDEIAPTRIRISSFILAAYIVAALVLFVTIGNDALDGKNQFEFFTDSVTYERAAQDNISVSDAPLGLIALDANYLGPVTILRTVAGNRYGVIAINSLILLLSVYILGRSQDLRRDRLLLILFMNPMTLSSVMSVNKEILNLLAISLLYFSVSRKSFPVFVLAALVGLFARWQMSLVCIIAYLSTTAVNPFRERRWLTLIILLLSISAAYPFIRPYLSTFDTILEGAQDTNEGGGLFFRLMDLQNGAAYILAFVPKTAHLMFGIMTRLDRFGDPEVFHNYTWIMLHSITMLIATIMVFATKRFSLNSDAIYIAGIYCAVVALSPIYAPRYFYPVHVMLAVALAQPRIRDAEFLLWNDARFRRLLTGRLPGLAR